MYAVTIGVTRTRKQVTQEISRHVKEDIAVKGAVKSYHPGNYVFYSHCRKRKFGTGNFKKHALFESQQCRIFSRFTTM
jgi:hypothetical protein